MKRKNMFIIIISLVLVGSFVSLGFAQVTPTPPSTQAGVKVLRWAYSMPSKKSHSFGWEWFGPEFEKRTQGRYKVEFYPGETLFKMAAAYDSVVSGVAQITNISVGQFERRLPLSSVTLIPTVDFPGSLKGRMAGGKSLMNLYQMFPQIQEEYKGIKLFGYHQLNPYLLASKKKEIYLPEHFKGLKVGGTGSKMKLVMNAGGADVTMVPPDAYMNMDKGVVDASFLSWSMIHDYKIYEVAKYFCDFSFSAGAFAMVMNQDAWNGMSPADQKIFMELWERAFEIATENTYSEVAKGTKEATDAGSTIKKLTGAEIDAWRKAAAPVIEAWINDAKKANAKDPEKILAEWQKSIDTFKE